MGKLTNISVKAARFGRHADGDGLYLLVKESGARSWMLRVQVAGKRRDIGLGSFEIVSLAEARERAAELRKAAKRGADPIELRDQRPVQKPTFEEVARSCHGEMSRGWKNKKHAESWLACLVSYTFPAIGDKPVDTIDSANVRDVLAPIWLRIPETSRRVLQRIRTVLDFAHINGWREHEASLRSVPRGLPKQPRSQEHFAAMRYRQVPAYYGELVASPLTIGRECLRLTILTAVRSNESRLATWPEVDFASGLWTIPASRMKMNEKHVVPLSDAAVALLRRRWEARTDDDGLVFFVTPRKPISDMTMLKALRDDGHAELTVHGFRSAFTDWAAEQTEHLKEVVDKALAHKLPDRVEAAYRRTDYLERRRKLMNEWAAFLGCQR